MNDEYLFCILVFCVGFFFCQNETNKHSFTEKIFDKDSPVCLCTVFSLYLAAENNLFFTDTYQTHYY